MHYEAISPVKPDESLGAYLPYKFTFDNHHPKQNNGRSGRKAQSKLELHENSRELTLGPVFLCGTFAYISSAKERVSVDEENPNSTSLHIRSAGEGDSLAVNA